MASRIQRDPNCTVFPLQEVLTWSSYMSHKYFEVLWFRACGYSHRQIANELKIPLGTAKSRISRATESALRLKRRYEIKPEVVYLNSEIGNVERTH